MARAASNNSNTQLEWVRVLLSLFVCLIEGDELIGILCVHATKIGTVSNRSSMHTLAIMQHQIAEKSLSFTDLCKLDYTNSEFVILI